MQFSINKQIYTNLSFITVAYVISVLVRYFAIGLTYDSSASFWNDTPILNTEDGFYFASLVQHQLDGTLQANPRLSEWYTHAISFITVFLATLTPWQADSIQFYLPMLVASAIVIPIFLTARLYMSTISSLFAAIIGSLAISYYNRTLPGYFDTDMFAVLWPMSIVYFLLAMDRSTKHAKFYIMAASLFLMLYPFIYSTGTIVALALVGIFMTIKIVAAPKSSYTYQVSILLILSITSINIAIKLPLLLITYWYFFIRSKDMSLKTLLIAMSLAAIMFIFSSEIPELIRLKLINYTARGLEYNDLFFMRVQVLEASISSFQTIIERISGNVFNFVVAMAGFIYLILRHKNFIITLPMLALGLFALWGGVRFTIYAVPIMTIAMFYITDKIATKKIPSIQWRNAFLFLAFVLFSYPHVLHIASYKTSPVLSAYEILTLDALKKKSSDQDYIITWWDYGYPVWYYANKNTLIDGGKHHRDNFIVSEIFSTSSQLEAAQLSHLATQAYIDSNYSFIADTLFFDTNNKPINVKNYLDQLKTDRRQLSEKTPDIFLYMPLQMLNIFTNVQKYSRLDLNSGEKSPDNFFYKTSNIIEETEQVKLGSNIILQKESGTLHVTDMVVPIKSVYTTDYDKDGTLNIEHQLINQKGLLNVVRMIDEHMVLVLDNETLQSTFIQLMVFENYDSELFELVEKNMFAKIYKVK